MTEKGLIDLSATGVTGWTGRSERSYASNGLLKGSSKPEKAFVRSLQDTRLTPALSKRPSRTTSAGSRTTVSSCRYGSYTAPSLLPRRATSTVSRGTSAVSRDITGRLGFSQRERILSSTVNGLLFETTGDNTDFSVCVTGLNVWRLENNTLHRLHIYEQGFFHQANCYLIYQSDSEENFLHVWSGRYSLKVDRETLKKHAAKLDKSVGGATFMSLECEGHETSSFLRHFQDGIVIVEGKSKQRLRRAVKYVKRLYKVCGRTHPSAICIECSAKAATENDVLILDGFPRMYVWMGQQADFVLRIKAIKLAKKIRTWQRNGRCHIIVVDQNNKHMSDAFLKKLDSDKQYDLDVGDITEENMTYSKPKLYKISGDRVLYDMPLVATQPLEQKYLSTKESFLLDMGPSCPLYIWVGNSTCPDKLFDSLNCTESFKQHHGYSCTTPVCRVMEGNETYNFKRTFVDWRDRILKGKTLFSKTDCCSVSKFTESWSDDNFLIGNGTVEMYQANENIVKHVPQEQHGVFYNSYCYIVLYKENISEEDQLIIYFWVGRKTSKESQDLAQKFALAMDSLLGHKGIIIRVLDRREPQHFLTVLHGNIIVYDADLGKDIISEDKSGSINNIVCCSNTTMFCVQELASECMRVSQVSPMSSSLNSAATYVVISDSISILWFGKNTTAFEREYSKNIHAHFCPERKHDYKIVIEGKESAIFWSLVLPAGDHPKQFPKPDFDTDFLKALVGQITEMKCKHKILRQSPTLAFYSRNLGKWFVNDLPDFTQEDLCEKDIFILDTHDQLQVWIGSSFMDRDHDILLKALQMYIILDPAGRKEEDLQVLFCHQGYEPSLFKKYFKSWDLQGSELRIKGEQAYETARKYLRQENATIDIDCQAVDMTYMETPKIPYKDLVKGEDLPIDIDTSHKEHYLSETEFMSILQMTRAQFYRLPLWKQHQILKSSRLMSHS